MAQTSTTNVYSGRSLRSPSQTAGQTPTLAALASDAVRGFGKRHWPRYRQRRLQEAATRTAHVVARRRELDGLLAGYLAGPAPGIDMERLKRPLPPEPEFDAAEITPKPAPEWEHFAPPTLRGLGKLTGASAYEKQREQAAKIFSMAVANYESGEAARRKRVDQVRHKHAELVGRVREQHGNIDRFVKAVRSRERKAVSRYFQQVLDQLRDPDGLPTRRRIGYVPEDGLLAIEWELPTLDVIGDEESFEYDSARDFIETRKRTDADRLRSYQRLIAGLALRAVHAVVHGDRYGVVERIVFNGVVEGVDPANKQPVRPCLISLSTTPLRFTALELEQTDPAACAREQLGANVSPRPERLHPVTPVLDFAEADPRRIHRPHR